MTMLIKGGRIHTMTGQGTFTGDILVRGGRIAAVDAHIELAADLSPCVLDASGLTILPGLIDPHIHDGAETDPGILGSPHAAGVTTGLLWPEDEGRCTILTQERTQASGIYAVHPANYTDAQLHDRFLSLAEEGLRPACEIMDALACRRVLQIVHSSRVKAILVHLSGCDELAEAVALSGCPAVLGVTSTRAGSPWALANRLASLGVAVSLTCNYPGARLRHLPLCAALCVREGMDRERALHMVTKAPAGLLSLSDAGCIASGCRADLAIYDGDPLLLSTAHVMTISGGKIRH